MSNPSYYLNGTLVSARGSQVPAASFANGANAAASCAPGIGIGEGVTAVAGTLDQFTLLDQAGAGRTPQDSQHIGIAGTPIKIGANNANGNGTVTSQGNATLASLAAGWTAE
jgi:hypothetical protein